MRQRRLRTSVRADDTARERQRAMIEAARKAVDGSHTRILAVTVLTSISDAALRGGRHA